MDLIGHSSVAMTRRYRSGSTNETLRVALERTSRELGAGDPRETDAPLHGAP